MFDFSERVWERLDVNVPGWIRVLPRSTIFLFIKKMLSINGRLFGKYSDRGNSTSCKRKPFYYN